MEGFIGAILLIGMASALFAFTRRWLNQTISDEGDYD